MQFVPFQHLLLDVLLKLVTQFSRSFVSPFLATLAVCGTFLLKSLLPELSSVLSVHCVSFLAGMRG